MKRIIFYLCLLWVFSLSNSIMAQESQEETFRKIQPMLNTDDRDAFKKAIESMENLASTGYIPALYEMCYTYGWYSDSVSLNRKKMLGIRYEMKEFPKYLPLDNQINSKATEYIKKILATAGAEYESIKAQAYFRLAAYYISDNRVFPTDMERAKKYLRTARKYAAKSAGSEELLQRIEQSLKNLENF